MRSLQEETCNYCNAPLEQVKYDCRTPTGRWGNFCGDCFTNLPLRLGIGLGQFYIREPNGRWVQVEGGSMPGKEF